MKTLRLAALPNKCFLQRSCNFCLTAMLFSLMLYWVQVTQAERDDLLANCTGKAVWMVSFSQSCHYFSFNKLPTPVAAGTIHALVIQGAKVFPILNEKASLCQVTATHWKKKKNNTLEKYTYKRCQKQSVLPADEITLVVLLLYIGFLPSPS